MKIQTVVLPYNTEGKGRGGASGPAVLIRAGVLEEMRRLGHEALEPLTVELTPAEEAEYGAWNRVGLAGSHLCRLVEKARRQGAFVLGLLADCNGVLGVLGGLQRSLPPEQRVGLVYVDAHGDYNTPETTSSGMLGGMPVAVATGKCLHRLRRQNGLETPLRFEDIVLAGLRDLEPLERAAIMEDRLTTLSERDLIGRSAVLERALDSLCSNTDAVYIHVDLDILDPAVAPAAGMPAPGGLTGAELGLALRMMLGYSKVAALSLVSYKADRDADERTLHEVVKALLAAFS